MAANNQSSEKPGVGRGVVRELDQLRKKVKGLTLRLEREVRARELATRLATEAKKAREQLSRETKALRDQGRRMAVDLKATITDANKREQALQEARNKITDLRANFARQTADLRRKSAELVKLAGESAHRAAEIMRSEGLPAEQSPSPSAEPPPEPLPESRSDKPTSA